VDPSNQEKTRRRAEDPRKPGPDWQALSARQEDAERELLKRERILDAITKIAAALLAAHTLDSVLPAALRQVGEAIATDRVVVLETTRAPDGGFLVHERGAWNAPGMEPPAHAGKLDGGPDGAAVLGGFFATLPHGQIFTMLPRKSQGPLAAFLRSLNVQSLLLVPILLDGKPWGYLGFNDCHAERKWTTAASDALQVLGEIIGASIARARRITQLADAKRIVENSTTVLFRYQAEPGLPISYISDNVSKWGYTPEQFLASPAFHLALVHPDDLSQVAAWMTSLLAGIIAPSWLMFRVRFADGNYHWFENQISAIRDQGGGLAAFEGMLFDVTARKQAEDRFNFVNALFVTATETSPNGFLVVGADRRILTCNQKFLEMWKIPPETGKTDLDEALLQAVGGNLKDPESFRAGLEHLYQHPEQEVQDEIEFKDGRVLERYSAALRLENQQHPGRMFFFRDITEQKRDEREMARLARTDPLTGLANRAAFLDRLDLVLAASRRGDTPFAVHYVDLDNFKDVNDSLGHQTGDVLLKTVAQRMTASVRETDLVSRFGGDEFSVIQSDVTDPSTAGTLAAKLRAILAEPYTIDGNVLRITATVGIAVYAPEVESAAEILAQADRALYRAKEEGRDRYRFHSQELDAVVHERVSIAEELRAGIDRDELELYYQPQVTVATGEVVGIEALVRWNHPRLGQLTPSAFLPAAERTGVIVPLGAWVLDKACQQFRLWRDQGVEPPAISVNLSGSQLKVGRDFYHHVQKTLLKWRLAPRDLEFDVPEDVLSDAFGANPDVLQKLHDLGVRIAIDDFGAEYTSIGRLKAYGVKRIKIAPQLIKSMTFNDADAGAVRLMLHLASQLGIEIIAKSVETEEQQAFLLSTAEGANAQGFFYSRPLPAGQATDFLRQKRVELPLPASSLQ
jgi:diguanylate cyclase (GGDEF)-like protein/PAS domain S-box-containing protein